MINFDFEEGRLTVYLEGEIDHHKAKPIREETDMLMVSLVPRDVVLDMSAVTLMDSSGLGLVLGRYTKAKAADISFSVVNADKRIIRIFEMAGMDRIIKFEGKKVI